MTARPEHTTALARPTEPPPTPSPSWSRRLGEGALQLTWRLVSPGDPAPFAVGARPPEPRIYYTADDGWRAPLYHLAPPAGAHGRPLLLAHGLGGGWRSLDLDPSHSLAGALADAGYTVYAMEHRGDRGALPPVGARPFSVDDVALRDLPAALDTIRAHSGFDRVLFLGVGLGGAAYLLHLALAGDPGVAAAVLVACPLQFPGTSGIRAAGRLATILPRGWRIPMRRLSQILTPLCADGEPLGAPDVAGPVARGLLYHGGSDLHAGVLRQLGRWVVAGTLTDQSGLVEVRAALAGRTLSPTLVVAGEHDPRCPSLAAEDLASVLGGEALSLDAGGALDLLLGERASGRLHPALIQFFDRWKDRCAGEATPALEVATVTSTSPGSGRAPVRS